MRAFAGLRMHYAASLSAIGCERLSVQYVWVRGAGAGLQTAVGFMAAPRGGHRIASAAVAVRRLDASCYRPSTHIRRLSPPGGRCFRPSQALAGGAGGGVLETGNQLPHAIARFLGKCSEAL